MFYLVFFLIILNILLIFAYNKKRLKKYFYKIKIVEKDIVDLHPIFKLRKINYNLKGPTKNSIVKNFCISPENHIAGMTSNYESWIISVLSTISKNIFEFGTCSGKTSYLMALNSDQDSIIYTTTLKPQDTEKYKNKDGDSEVAQKNIINESIYDKFLFSGEPEEKKIKVIFTDSLLFDEKKFHNKIDLIFIDGGHTFSVVKNDTEKAFKMIKTKGIILWHDYNLGKRSSKDVVKYLNLISEQKRIFKVKNTSLCFYQKI
tara:strand:- start:504 stop:1283 length:780 start_codon:yes stop_codon:yes gene_type:complete